MGEVVAGITLGPTILGGIAPELQAALFPTDIMPVLGVVANLGLIFYMFLVGLEIDPSQLKGRIGQAAAISNTSVALPMMLGIAVALPIYELVGPDKKFVAFALFMGVAMSITAFPVLARILVERRMLKRPVGALALACAAIDDVTAWFLIALATAVAVAGSGGEVLQTIALAVRVLPLDGALVRPLLGACPWPTTRRDACPAGWIAAIFAGVLLSAYTTEEIGIAVIFGAFIMGMIMPRHAGLTEDVTHRIEDFVVRPAAAAVLRLHRAEDQHRPARPARAVADHRRADRGGDRRQVLRRGDRRRLTGFDWRASAVIGTLMNTRGLTELIVLNLALEKGVISEALFATLVIMALVTTFMAGPLLKLLDPKNELRRTRGGGARGGAREVSAAEFPDCGAGRGDPGRAATEGGAGAAAGARRAAGRGPSHRASSSSPGSCNRRSARRCAGGCRPRTGCCARRLERGDHGAARAGRAAAWQPGRSRSSRPTPEPTWPGWSRARRSTCC